MPNLLGQETVGVYHISQSFKPSNHKWLCFFGRHPTGHRTLNFGHPPRHVLRKKAKTGDWQNVTGLMMHYPLTIRMKPINIWIRF